MVGAEVPDLPQLVPGAYSGVRDQPGVGRCACCELLRFHFAALEKKRA